MSIYMYVIGVYDRPGLDIYESLDFDSQSYDFYGWLADVRNYAQVPVLSPPRGLPEDTPQEVRDRMEGNWSLTWYDIDELLNFDWNQTFEYRRGMVQTAPNVWDGGATMAVGGGRMTTYAEEFGYYRKKLLEWKSKGVQRLLLSFC
jgi:hypothetical protein